MHFKISPDNKTEYYNLYTNDVETFMLGIKKQHFIYTVLQDELIFCQFDFKNKELYIFTNGRYSVERNILDGDSNFKKKKGGVPKMVVFPIRGLNAMEKGKVKFYSYDIPILVDGMPGFDFELQYYGDEKYWEECREEMNNIFKENGVYVDVHPDGTLCGEEQKP